MEGFLSAKKRMKLALWFGSSDRNLSNTAPKSETVASTTFSGIFFLDCENRCSKDESEIAKCEFGGKLCENAQ